MPNLLSSSEIIISNTDIRQSIANAVRQGKIIKIASRIYTSNFNDSPETIIKRNLWEIVGQLVPGALISDRTALELKPTYPDGSLFITSNRKRDIQLPGVIIRTRKDHVILPGDNKFMSGLYLSSNARAYLDNLRVSRPRTANASRTLGAKNIEERLDNILRKSGEESVNKIRDEARIIAQQLNMDKEFKKLDEIIGALLGTRDAQLFSQSGIARKMGKPYDPDRLKLLEELHRSLHNTPPIIRQSKGVTDVLSFYEAYFSNFIEGTEFAVNEAEEIIFEGKIPNDRPIDAHDIVGTYQVVSNHAEMTKIPSNFENFLELLQKRHAIIMSKRPEVQPGKFKVKSNRSGSTLFVSPELVEGTLKKRF